MMEHRLLKPFMMRAYDFFGFFMQANNHLSRFIMLY